MIEKFKKYVIDLRSKQSSIDNKVNTLYHDLEFNTKTRNQMLNVTKELKKTLRERRKIKVEISLIQGFIYNTKDISQIK